MLDQEHLEYFSDLIRSSLGIEYKQDNLYQLQTRLLEICKESGIGSIGDLRSAIALNDANARSLKSKLLDRSTNNETSFFRDTAVFESIVDLMTTKIREKLPAVPYRIWSAACSSGQEPYSIAMMLSEHIDLSVHKVEIIATDVSDQILERAKNGVYNSLEISRGLSEDRKRAFFEPAPQGDGWLRVKPKLKSIVEFRALNLLDRWPGLGPFDFVLCRNVLIYQSVERKRAILEKVFATMKPGAHLVLGAAESLLDLASDFEQISHGRAILYTRQTRLDKKSA